MTTRLSLTIALALAALLGSCSGISQTNDPAIHLNGKAQGTYYSITYYDSCNRNFGPQIDSIFLDIDFTASLWEEYSLVRRLNSGEDSVLNHDMEELLSLSLDMWKYTHGAFDCRVGALVSAWGFSFRQRKPLPDSLLNRLLEASQEVIEIEWQDDGTPVYHRYNKNTELDFNAIAQGYTSDKIGAFLESRGITNYLVDVGGEVLAHGTKQGGKLWTVGIEKPARDSVSPQEVMTAVELRDLAIVTSGNYRKYYEKDGVRYSHTIDPRTGRPVEHSLLSVSVIDSAAWRADALATAFMVMGMEDAKAFIAEHDDVMGAYFIYDDHGTNKTSYTGIFKELIKE